MMAVQYSMCSEMDYSILLQFPTRYRPSARIEVECFKISPITSLCHNRLSLLPAEAQTLEVRSQLFGRTFQVRRQCLLFGLFWAACLDSWVITLKDWVGKHCPYLA